METITGNVSAALLSNGQGFHVLGVGVSTGAGEGKTFANVVGAGLNIRVGEQQVAAVIPSTTHRKASGRCLTPATENAG